MNRVCLSLQHLLWHTDGGGDTCMLNRIVTGDESWVHQYQPQSKHASMQWKHSSSPSTKKFKVMSSAGKVMLTVFWDSQGLLLAHFQKHGENVNFALYEYPEVLLKLWDAIRRKPPGHWQGGYYLIMTMPDAIQAEQPRREFKNYSGNFLNIWLTARTWPLVISICLVR
jgi:hypothetical protein